MTLTRNYRQFTRQFKYGKEEKGSTFIFICNGHLYLIKDMIVLQNYSKRKEENKHKAR